MIDNNSIGLHSIIKCNGEYGIFYGYKDDDKEYIRFRPYKNSTNCITYSEFIEEIVFNTNLLENNNYFVINHKVIVYIKSFDYENLIIKCEYAYFPCLNKYTYIECKFQDITSITEASDKDIKTLLSHVLNNGDIIKYNGEYYIYKYIEYNSYNNNFIVHVKNHVTFDIYSFNKAQLIEIPSDNKEIEGVKLVYNMRLRAKNKLFYDNKFMPKYNTYYELKYIGNDKQEHFTIIRTLKYDIFNSYCGPLMLVCEEYCKNKTELCPKYFYVNDITYIKEINEADVLNYAVKCTTNDYIKKPYISKTINKNFKPFDYIGYRLKDSNSKIGQFSHEDDNFVYLMNGTYISKTCYDIWKL